MMSATFKWFRKKMSEKRNQISKCYVKRNERNQSCEPFFGQGCPLFDSSAI